MVKSLNKFVTNAIPVLLARFTGDFYQPLVTTANYVGDKLYGLYLKVLEFSAKSAQAFLVAMTHGKKIEP
jgi:hypothetical protein